MDINKLLEERGKVHGDAKASHELAYRIFKMMDSNPYNILTDASRSLLFMDTLKSIRGTMCPSHVDHWDDKQGYTELIKRIECRGSPEMVDPL